MGKLGPGHRRECVGQTEAHLSRGALFTQLPPRCMTHHPAQSACVREGESLPERGSCWSLIACRLFRVCHPLGRAVRHEDRTWPPPSHPAMASSGAAVASEAQTIPSSLCPICAHLIAGKGITKLSVQLFPLMLPAPRQMCVFRPHELSRLGTSCNLAETPKEYPDVAGSAVRWGQPRTNSVLIGAMVLLASNLPNRKLLLICWWLVATRTTRTFHPQLLEPECHWPSPL